MFLETCDTLVTTFRSFHIFIDQPVVYPVAVGCQDNEPTVRDSLWNFFMSFIRDVGFFGQRVRVVVVRNVVTISGERSEVQSDVRRQHQIVVGRNVGTIFCERLVFLRCVRRHLQRQIRQVDQDDRAEKNLLHLHVEAYGEVFMKN